MSEPKHALTFKIMLGVATAFIAQVYGVDIGLQGYLMVVLTATLASIGTAGVPGVDRLLDMARTVVNVTGDAVVSCVVARSEGQLSMDA